MKRKILSLILVFAMTVSLLTVGTGAVEPTYGDTAGHWAESSIERWSGHGIIQGSNGLFDPNGQLTCAQLATILAKLLKLPAAKDAGFTDNTADAWYFDAINRCAAAGILNGNGDGTVTPEAPITRERAMVMLARALGIEPIRKPDLTKYTDAAQVSAYAQGYVAALIEAGIVGGVTADQLAPQNNITRAATVTILDRAISTYADKAGATVKADGKGIVLVVAENVKITGAPEGTKIVVADGATGLTVNGKSVSDDQTYIVPKTEPAKPSSGSSGGYSHSHSYNETTHKCSCGAFDPAVVATIGNTTGYLTLKEAVAAATNGQIVKLMKDTSENIIIPNGKTIVIDLNGKKLTNADSHTIVNNGNLTIQGSGTVDNVTHQKAALVNYGTAVLNGGTYTRSLENPENNKDNSGGNSYYTILNDKGGNMTINAGVEVTNVGHFSSMICNGGDANSSAMSKLTIHGGVFSGGINTVKNDELGELTITDGSFSNASQCVIMNWHKANISGGTFETNEGAETVLFTAKYHDTRAIGKLTVTGGTYICKTDQALLCDRYNNNEKYLGTASIAGGTFSRRPEAKYIAAGYEAKDNEDGTWTVGAAASATFAAQVGGVMYTTLAAALDAADENAIVKLLEDVPGQVAIPAGKNLTLDLNGKKITHSGTAIINNGTLIVKNGTVVSTGNCGIGVGSNSETTILSDVTVTAQESAVITSTSTGASIIIEGGTFTSTDNAVIAGNGSERDGEPNTILIKDGTFNGGITSEGFVACGIYAPWKDEITVKGGTFNIRGGAGIVARAGQVSVDGGTFTCTGNATGKVGDSRVVVPCAALVFDSEANYPALNDESVILVKNGTFTVESGVAVAQAVKAAEDLNPRISIKGGSFSSDPSAYVAEGYIARENNGKYVVSMVGTAENPYTLNEFNALTKLPAGRTELYVDIGDVSLADGDVTIGNKNICDMWTWDRDMSHNVGDILEDRRKVYMVRESDTIYSSNKAGITLYISGSVKENPEGGLNQSDSHVITFSIPDASNVVFTKDFTVNGYFRMHTGWSDGRNLGGAVYNRTVKTVLFDRSTFNGIWIQNGGFFADSLTLDGCTFNAYENKVSANDSNPLWFCNIRTCNVTVKNCTFKASRPIKVVEQGVFGANVTITGNKFDMSLTNSDDDASKPKNDAIMFSTLIGETQWNPAGTLGNVVVSGNEVTGANALLTFFNPSQITMANGATFTVSGNMLGTGVKTSVEWKTTTEYMPGFVTVPATPL